MGPGCTLGFDFTWFKNIVAAVCWVGWRRRPCEPRNLLLHVVERADLSDRVHQYRVCVCVFIAEAVCGGSATDLWCSAASKLTCAQQKRSLY
jgi:hypothetical protein